MKGTVWRHHEAYVEAKQSCEELIAIGWTDLELLDHFAPRVCSAKISKDALGMCNSSINMRGCPNQAYL